MADTKGSEESGREYARKLLASGTDYETALREFKRLLAEEALAKRGGCKAAAGRDLQVTRAYVRRLVNTGDGQQRKETAGTATPGTGQPRTAAGD
jgi:hypothetical protein